MRSNLERDKSLDQDTNIVYFGVGIGPHSEHLDPAYDPVKDSWLLATVDYDVIGLGHTDLFLEIGQHGLNNAEERSSDTEVVFGDSVDEPRNGETGRLQPTTNPQARIWSVPEPSTMVLAVLVLLGLAVIAPSRLLKASRPSRPVNTPQTLHT